jgi:hypothetical protein
MILRIVLESSATKTRRLMLFPSIVSGVGSRLRQVVRLLVRRLNTAPTK